MHAPYVGIVITSHGCPAVELRQRSHLAALRALDAEVESPSDRLKKLEGRGSNYWQGVPRPSFFAWAGFASLRSASIPRIL